MRRDITADSKPVPEEQSITTTSERAEQIGIGWWAALLPLALTLFFVGLIPDVAAGQVHTLSWEWVPSLGVSFSFYIDGLALIMALLVAGIGTLIYLYAGRYLAGDEGLLPFYIWVTLFMLAMLGLVTAGNVLTLFVFWELTSISSYLLIGYKHKVEYARDAALQALLITGGGGLVLLAGLILMGGAIGSYEFADVLTSGDLLRGHPFYVPVLLLVLVGAFTKSAQVPFHFWLPGAMAAPTPVSAYLHSATMVKAGVYLLARLNPTLGGTALWTLLLLGFGGATMVVGAFLAWQQRDLKRILAYSTVSALGALIFLIGIGTQIALKAALVFLIVHSLYKGALFLVAGSVDHATGSRDVTLLGGLSRAMPWTAAAAALAALSMAGLPPFFGFVGKELIYEATLFAPSWATGLTIVAVIANVFNVVVAGLVAVRPFWGRGSTLADHAHEGGFFMILGPALLAFGGLVSGLLLTPVGAFFVGPAVSAVAGEPTPVSLYLWHGFNTMLVLSILTVALGAVIYRFRGSIGQPLANATEWIEAAPARGYKVGINGLKTGATGLTRRLQNGRLRQYVRVILMAAVLLVAGAMILGGISPQIGRLVDVRLHELAVAVIILVAASIAVRAGSRLAAVLALGVVGYGISIFFVLLGAPDLAMTLFAVETLTVLLFVLVLYRLPRFASLTSRGEQIQDGIVALIGGVLMALVVISTVDLPHPATLTTYFAQNSLTLAQGRNVVNVILVDFRSMDTLGEVVVLAVAATGVYALMKLRLVNKKIDGDTGDEEWEG
ncbi:MAG: putative monovalent cation/H+ antiporter subunit A [Caldilineaceae bacterium]|nr:putative monovalent cation/H+ antiporter subunit A [Caldilineaceae bacterium]